MLGGFVARRVQAGWVRWSCVRELWPWGGGGSMLYVELILKGSCRSGFRGEKWGEE